MTDLQALELQLLKEIDAICRENDIVYYAAGGTVLGAARHKGFIPWDDDIDIYMTVENFERFRRVLKENPVPGRKLECREDNPEFCSLIPRYVDENTTHIHRYNMIGNASAGVLVDIFILDSFSGDREKLDEYLAKLNIYSDMIVPFYAHSNRNDDKYFCLYDEYKHKVEEEGKESVIKELEGELFSSDGKEGDRYILRWGSLANVFPKNMMSEPEYLDFESIIIPVPNRWYDYLVQLYGSQWYRIPDNTISEHIGITNLDIPYTLFYRERDRYIDSSELNSIYQRRKDDAIRLQKYRRPLEKWVMHQRGNVLKHKISGQMNLAGIEELFDSGRYKEITEIMDEYYCLQSSGLCYGSLTHNEWNKRNYPILIEIDDNLLKYTLMSYIYLGENAKAERIINAYKKRNRITPAIAAADEINQLILRIEEAFYTRDFNRCKSLCDAIGDDKLRHSMRIVDYYRMSCALTEWTYDEFAEALSEVKNNTGSIETAKACADAMMRYGYDGGGISLNDLYKKVLEESRNGMLCNDIVENTGLEADYSPIERFIPDSVDNKHIELFMEVIRLCDEYDISYVVSHELASRLVGGGNLGHMDLSKSIYMDAENAIKFIKAVRNSGFKNRTISSWQTHSNIRNFRLYYMDDNTLNAPYNRLMLWEDIGISIEIIILRSLDDSLSEYKALMKEEDLINVRNTYSVDLKTQKRRISAQIGEYRIRVKGDSKYTKKVFDSIMSKENHLSGSAQFYYRNNLGGNSYRITRLPKDILETSETVDFGGLSISIPKGIMSEYRNGTLRDEYDSSYTMGLFSNMDTDLSWREFKEIVSLKEGESLDWASYQQARNESNKNIKERDFSWLVIERAEDKVYVYEYYRKMRERIANEVRNENWDELKDCLSLFHQYTYRYVKRGMAFIADGDIFNAYIEMLRNTGDSEWADEVCELSGKDTKSNDLINEYIAFMNYS